MFIRELEQDYEDPPPDQRRKEARRRVREWMKFLENFTGWVVEDGKAAGLRKGRLEGWREGRREGRQEALAALRETMAMLAEQGKFFLPETAAQEIAKADLPQLKQWIVRLAAGENPWAGRQ